MATVSGEDGGPGGVACATADAAGAAQAKYAKEINSYINEYIRFADLKAGAALTLTVAIGGAIGSAVPKVIGAASGGFPTKVILGALLVIAAICIGMTILFLAFSLVPRTPAVGLRSLNSFPDIAQFELSDYVVQVSSLSESTIVENLSVHNITLARVAQKKFGAITMAFSFLTVLVFTAFLIIIFYVCANF